MTNYIHLMKIPIKEQENINSILFKHTLLFMYVHTI